MARTFCSAIALIALTMLAWPLRAADNSEVAKHWQALTRIDVDAAYALIKQNHPGIVPEAGDPEFVAALEAAHDHALARAAATDKYEGYIATLGEFANALGDGHIWSHPLFDPRNLQWAGIVAAKRGPDWIVAGIDTKKIANDLLGARIIGCDGQTAEERAQDALRFRTVASVEAMQVIFGIWLLLDDGNPFLQRPRVCVFEKNRRRHSVTLDWTTIPQGTFSRQYWKSPFGSAGFALRRIGSGYWISIEHFTPEATAVITAANAIAPELRTTQFVVLDLRGNVGGDHNYGRVLTQVLYGADYVLSVLGPAGTEAGGCAEVFRASQANIDADKIAIDNFLRSGDTYAAKVYGDDIEAMKTSLASGRMLTGPLGCKKRESPSSAPAKSRMQARVFVLTDSLCFSSCINTVEDLLKLGATQIGQATGADTHYSEVREITLPSGLSTFSTLQAIIPDEPREIGPYIPRYMYDGDIADTKALENWISATVVPDSEKRMR